MLRQAQHERKRGSRAVRLSTNGKGNARQLSSPVRPELSRRVSGSGGRIVVVEHAGLRSCFDKLSTNGRESHGQFGSARMVRETHVSYPLPFALSSRRVSGSGGRIVVVEHAGLRSCFDKLSTNGREGHGQFGSARMVRGHGSILNTNGKECQERASSTRSLNRTYRESALSTNKATPGRLLQFGQRRHVALRPDGDVLREQSFDVEFHLAVGEELTERP